VKDSSVELEIKLEVEMSCEYGASSWLFKDSSARNSNSMTYFFFSFLLAKMRITFSN